MDKATLDKAAENLALEYEVITPEPGECVDGEWMLPDGRIVKMGVYHYKAAYAAGFTDDESIRVDTEESQGYINALLAEGWLRLRGNLFEVWELNSKTIKHLERLLDLDTYGHVLIYVYTEAKRYKVSASEYRDCFKLRRCMELDEEFECSYGHHIAPLADILDKKPRPEHFSLGKIEKIIEENSDDGPSYKVTVNKGLLILVKVYAKNDIEILTAELEGLWERCEAAHWGDDIISTLEGECHEY